VEFYRQDLRESKGFMQNSIRPSDKWIGFEDAVALLGFGVLALALPLSNLFMSIGLFIAAAAALSRIIRTIIFRNSNTWRSGNLLVLLPALIWLFTLVGGWGSDNKDHWLWDVRVKLPLVLLPLFAWLFHEVLKRNFLVIVGFFIIGVTTACVVCFWFALNGSHSSYDMRNASVFISHIRFGLMMAMVIPLLYFSTGISEAKRGLKTSLMLVFIFLFFSYEIVTANLTGMALMITVLLFISIHYSVHSKNRTPRIVLCFLFFILLSVSFYVRSEYISYFTIRDADETPMELSTANGEPYLKCEYPFIVEEGRVTERYIALNELDSAWEARTKISLDSRDSRGQPLRFTLIRYLTSLDLRKDAKGVSQLSDEDVLNVFAGYTNVHEQHRPAMVNRMYALFYEWAVYKESNVVSGHSLFQRLEFWRAGRNIIRQNAWWGIGPGDVPDAFARSYDEINTTLDVSNRLRAHNQWMTFWISFGVFGCIALLFVLWWPVYKLKWALLTCFVLISFLSFLTEDTLETQAGVCFYAFFSAVLMAVRVR
jgi:hypothetical protein